MICKSCGRANELGARFCKSCGAPLESNESMQQNNTNQSENVCQQNNQYVMPESMYSGTTRMTKKEFNECANIKSITKNITAAAIIAYVIGAITFIVNVVMAGKIAGLVDVMIVVGLGLGIHLAKRNGHNLSFQSVPSVWQVQRIHGLPDFLFQGFP